ncbi:MAG: phosphoglucomutase/phosphomannomutase family protein [Lachnospiraceae bacterium]|nr:phosphoglucomutase/phosphomannomutase family protein [Lachnospiraceae bacterium]
MIQFGTGGWRAIIGDEFTRRNIQILAAAMAKKMKKEGVADQGIVMGYDRRFLSKETIYWSCEVFAAEQIRVFFVNRSVPTPTIMFYVMKHKLPYGMMVTASHNPAIYNGIKVFTAGGRDADERQTKEIEAYIQEVEANLEQEPVKRMDYQEALKKGLVMELNPLNEYLDNILEQIDVRKIREAGLHIALDPMFGVSQTSLKTILLTARCDVDIINERHDTLFGGRLPAPASDTLHALQTHMIDYHCDIGLATDGDADRIGVIDDKGNFVHPNGILVLLYYYLVKYKGWKGPVVRNIATTHMLDRVAESFGEKCYEVPVGFKYISAKMQETDAIIGGESSGGLTVKGHINGKDGVYAAALLVEMLAVTGKRISEIAEDINKQYGTLYMVERSYRFTAERKAQIHRFLLEEKKLPKFEQAVEKISYRDGCKVYFADGGWVIARFSGTEPLLRIFCEMDSKREAEEICGQYEAFLTLSDADRQ